jgi:hypothetical protein
VEERANVKFQTSMAAEDNPSTRTSKDNKNSPTPIVPKAGYKSGHSLDRSTDGSEHSTEKKGKSKVASFAPSNEHSQFGHGQGAGAGHDEDYMSAFKSLVDASPSKQGQKQFDFSEGSSKKLSPKPLNAADLLLQKRPTAESERENAERVDALLFELFPERFQKQEQAGKKTKGKVSKKASALALAKEIAAGAGVGIGAGAAAGYNKNQVKLSGATIVSCSGECAECVADLCARVFTHCVSRCRCCFCLCLYCVFVVGMV